MKKRALKQALFSFFLLIKLKFNILKITKRQNNTEKSNLLQ